MPATHVMSAPTTNKMTKTLTIDVEDDEDLILATEEVLRLLKEGYTSGIGPNWDIETTK